MNHIPNSVEIGIINIHELIDRGCRWHMSEIADLIALQAAIAAVGPA